MQDSSFDPRRGDLGQTPDRKHTVVTALLCVAAAICIWFYVMSIDSPAATETFTSVNVSVINDRDPSRDGGLSAISGTGNVIEVKLKGRKNILNNLSAEQIEASVDVTGVTAPGKGIFPVHVEAPAGTIIEEYYPTEIPVYMDKKSTTIVPIHCRLTDYTVGSSFTLDQSGYELNINHVQITGPESELAMVEYARMTLSPGTVTQSFSGTAPLELVDQNGKVIHSKYIQLAQTEATARYNVYTTKYLMLTADTKYGYFEKNGTKVTLNPTKILVRGLVEQLNALSAVTVTTIDETQIVEDGTYIWDITLPDGVELADDTQEAAVSCDIRFEHTKLTRMTIPAENIRLVNIPAGKEARILDDNLVVSIRGQGMDYLYLRKQDVIVEVDLENAVSAGDQFLPATVRLRGGSNADCYTVGTYSVQVYVEDKT